MSTNEYNSSVQKFQNQLVQNQNSTCNFLASSISDDLQNLADEQGSVFPTFSSQNQISMELILEDEEENLNISWNLGNCKVTENGGTTTE